jgi:hypothetical protein
VVRDPNSRTLLKVVQFVGSRDHISQANRAKYLELEEGESYGLSLTKRFLGIINTFGSLSRIDSAGMVFFLWVLASSHTSEFQRGFYGSGMFGCELLHIKPLPLLFLRSPNFLKHFSKVASKYTSKPNYQPQRSHARSRTSTCTSSRRNPADHCYSKDGCHWTLGNVLPR